MTDLVALADRLENDADNAAANGLPAKAERDRTAARILRAVAAAPSPIEGDCGSDECDWCKWLDDLGRAVGEP